MKRKDVFCGFCFGAFFTVLCVIILKILNPSPAA